jgi:hypothetical protein
MAYKSNISNGSDWIEHCNSLSGWTDADSGTGVSTQETFDGRACFKFDTGASAGDSNYARRQKDVGSFAGNIFSFGLYHDNIGLKSNSDHFYMVIYVSSTLGVTINFANDGVYLYDGGAYNKVGSEIFVEQDVWQDWTFTVNKSLGTCSIYLGGVLIASNVDCSYTGSFTEGLVVFTQYGYNTTNCITYVDYGLAGNTLIKHVISNASYLDDNCSNISGWTDGDTFDAESTQVTFDSKSCFKFDSGSAGDNHFSRRWRDFGSFAGVVVISMPAYAVALGTRLDSDMMRYIFYGDTLGVFFNLASDGLFVYDGDAYNEVGTNIVTLNEWQEWTFEINFSAETLNVFLDGLIIERGVDCSYTSSGLDGQVYIDSAGYTTSNRIFYSDFIKIGNGFLDTDFTYYFSGYIYEKGSPVSRTVCLHTREGGELMNTTTSSGDGYYYIETSSSGSHYIVCLDDSAGENYNDLIIGDVYPTTISG